MSLFGITKGLSNLTSYLIGGSEDSDQRIDYTQLSNDKLLIKASKLKSENENIKEKINKLSNENCILKNSIINDKANSSHSEFGKLYNNILKQFIKQKAENFDVKNFENFLYNQKLFYGFSEEDKYNNIEKFNEINDSNFKEYKEDYLFRQNILERNLNEIYRNLLMSKELSCGINRTNRKIENDLKKLNTIIRDKNKNEICYTESNNLKNSSLFYENNLNKNEDSGFNGDYLGKKRENYLDRHLPAKK